MALTSYTGTSGNLINLNVPQDYSGAYFTVNTTIPAGVYQMTIPSTVNSVFIGTKTFTASGLVNIPTTQTVAYGDIKYVPTIWTTRANAQGNVPTGRIAYGNGTFVTHRSGSNGISSSTDGLSWTARLNASSVVSNIVWGNGVFVASVYGSSDNIGRWHTSTDGITWTSRSSGTLGSSLQYTLPGDLGTTYGNGIFVTVGTTGSGANYIVRSYDSGTTWPSGGTVTIPNFGSGNLKAVGYGNNSFIVVGNSGNMAASGNSVTWTTRVSGTASALYAIAYGNGLWVAGGGGGVLQTSSDGVTWTARTSNIASAINKVTYLNGTWYALGGSGGFTQSTDGITWTVAASPNWSSGYNDLAYGKGRYVLTNESDNLFVSSYTVPSDVTVQLEYKGVGSVAV